MKKGRRGGGAGRVFLDGKFYPVLKSINRHYGLGRGERKRISGTYSLIS